MLKDKLMSEDMVKVGIILFLDETSSHYFYEVLFKPKLQRYSPYRNYDHVEGWKGVLGHFDLLKILPKALQV